MYPPNAQQQQQQMYPQQQQQQQQMYPQQQQVYPQQGVVHPPPPTEWSSGILDCGKDISNCCVTCFCPCVTFGQIADIVDQGSPPCILSGMIYAVLHPIGFACCYSCFCRTKLRARFNLTEGPCGDCLIHCFCESCALCQEYRELKHRGYDPALGWTGNLQKQQQQQGIGMGMGMAAPVGQFMNKP